VTALYTNRLYYEEISKDPPEMLHSTPGPTKRRSKKGTIPKRV
jgi:hypothetical protein